MEKEHTMLNIETTAKSRKGRVSTKAIEGAPVQSAKRARASKAKADIEAKVAPVIAKAVKKGRAKAKPEAAPVATALIPAQAPIVNRSATGRTSFSLPDGKSASLRASGKRAAIVKAWLVNNRITLDEVATITGWSKAVNSSELFQIAAIFKSKIARNGVGEYQFLLD